MYVTAGLTFTTGKNERAIFRDRGDDDYVNHIRSVSRKFFVLWDVKTKRGWLVNGASCLLHLLRTSLKRDRTDRLSFLFSTVTLEDAAQKHDHASAERILISSVNRRLQLYQDQGTGMHVECVENRVLQLCKYLGKACDTQILAYQEDGFRIPLGMPGESLEGWDFDNIADRDDEMYSRYARLPFRLKRGSEKDWVDLIKEKRVVVLFGNQFGEILRPAPSNHLCTYWSTLPASEYYLGACIADLKYMRGVKEDPRELPLKLSESIFWHPPTCATLFGPCWCRDQCHTAQSGRVQLLSSGSSPHGYPFDRGQLWDTGAVVFGYIKGLRWFNRPETATQAQPPLEDSGERGSPSSPELSEDDVTAASSSHSQPHSSQTNSRKNEFVQGEQCSNPAAAQALPIAKPGVVLRNETVLPTILSLGSEEEAPSTSSTDGKDNHWSREEMLKLLTQVRADRKIQETKSGKRRET